MSKRTRVAAILLGIAIVSTPAWSSPTANGTFGSSLVQAQLGSHGLQEIYQGASIVTNNGASLDDNENLAVDLSLDQPFVMSGTTIGRVELPFTFVSGYVSGIDMDVNVGLYADSGGNPTGAAIASTTVPAEFINNPSSHPLLGEAWNNDTNQATLPPLLTADSASAAYGNVIVVAGGASSPNIYNTTYSTVVSDSGLSSWNQQASLPVAMSSMAGAISPTGYFYSVGGYNNATGSASSITSTVYFASVDLTTGEVGAWLTGTSFPIPIANGVAAVVGDGTNGYVLYVIAQVTSSGGVLVADNALYSAPINSDGSLGSWTQQTSIGQLSNSMVNQGASLTVINGWLVLIYYTGVSHTYYTLGAKINGNSIGPWIPFPTQNTGSITACTWGNYLVTTQGIQHNALEVTTSGPVVGGWVQIPSAFATGLGLACTTTQAGTLVVPGLGYERLHASQMVSVPLRATGLTNAATYHIVMTPAGTVNASAILGLPLISGTSTTAQYQLTPGVWTPFNTGNGFPFTLYSNSASGSPVHIIEDVTSGVPAHYNWFTWDYWGKLTSYGEWLGNLRSMRTITYDSSGLPTQVS